jgi:hypothetical protein
MTRTRLSAPSAGSNLRELTRVVELARRDGPAFLEQPPAAVWERIAAATGEAAVPADAARPDAYRPTALRAAANGSAPAGGEPGSGPPADGWRPRRPTRQRRRRLALAVAGLIAGLVIGIGGTVAVTALTRPPATQVVAEIELRPLPQFPQWEAAAGTAVLRQTPAAQLGPMTQPPRRPQVA